MRHELIPVAETIAPDAEMQRLVDEVMQPHRALLAEVDGKISTSLHRGSILFSPMDDILLAAIAETANTDIAFSNGWRYGAPILPGPVTMNDLWNIIPTNPPVFTVELTGAEIKQMMEENLDRTFSADPFGQMGGYLRRFRGLTIYGKLENPPGHRIEHVFSGDEPLQSERRYKVAFVTDQGVPMKFGQHRQDLVVDAIDALRNYFEAKPADPISDPISEFGRFIPV